MFFLIFSRKMFNGASTWAPGFRSLGEPGADAELLTEPEGGALAVPGLFLVPGRVRNSPSAAVPGLFLGLFLGCSWAVPGLFLC